VIVIKSVFLCVLVLCGACVKHDVPIAELKPIAEFTGRLLVINQAHRYQMEIDWQADDKQGKLRLTHALTGQVVDVAWQEKTMLWRNSATHTTWQPLSVKQLKRYGIIFPPWVLRRIFLGEMPDTMKTKDGRLWQGMWSDDIHLMVRWSATQQRVEMVDMKHGRKAVVIFDE